MLTTLKKILKDCLTENDGKSYCPVRCCGVALTIPTILTYVYAGARMAIVGTFPFPFHDFAMSFTVIAGGISAVLGIGVAAKAFTDKDMQ
jgi:hypothetical protein